PVDVHLSLPPPYLAVSLFSWYAAHRDLHSFPTRRSSDLGRPPPRASPAFRGRSATAASRACGPVRTEVYWAGRRPASRIGMPARSEEHMSELQSRENLVCRLLLEKKKQEPHRTNDASTAD